MKDKLRKKGPKKRLPKKLRPKKTPTVRKAAMGGDGDPQEPP